MPSSADLERACARLLVAASVLVFVGVGVGRVWWPDAQQLAELRRTAHDMYEAANENERIIQQAAQIRALRERTMVDLRSLRGSATPTAALAASLHLIAEESTRYGVSIAGVEPDLVQRDERAGLHQSILISTPLSVGIHGRFRNILALVSDLPRHGALIDVRGITLSADDRSGAQAPELTGTIRADVMQLRDGSLFDHDR